MKKVIILCLFSFISSFSIVYAQYEEAAIKELLREGYQNGYFNSGIERNLELSFSKEFRMISVVDQQPTYIGLTSLYNQIAAWKASGEYPRERDEYYNLYYHRIEINGDYAQAKINLTKGGKPVAMQYINLYKSKSGWLVLSIVDLPKEGDENHVQ